MNSPHRTKRLKGINGSQSKLTLFQKSIPSGLTATAIMTLYWISQGLNQKAIAKQLRCSKSNVSHIVKRLKAKGLVVHPAKAPESTHTAGRPLGINLDVRFRSLKWQLTHPVDLPYDEAPVNCGVEFRIWHVKDATVRQNIGKRQYSLEIECGYTEGSSMNECIRKHDEEALNVYDWLVQHFPDLAAVSSRLGYEINRKGEITIPQMKEFAEKWLETHTRLDAGVFKIDDSLKNGGEFQIKLDNLLTKDDFAKLEGRIEHTNATLMKVADSLAGLHSLLKKLIDGAGGEGSVPIKPIGKDDEGMYR